MTIRSLPLYFYLPEYREIPPKVLEQNISEICQWHFQSKIIPDGTFAWVLQTYLYLRHHLPCELTGDLPSQGILFAHRRSLPYSLKPNSQLLIVCLEADYDRHPYAQFRVLQNRYTASLNPSSLEFLGGAKSFLSPQPSTFISHWPQEGLLPRETARGDRVENVGFFGISANLAPELRGDSSWETELQSLGMNWYYRAQKQGIEPGSTQINAWQDYHDIDVVVAVRSFQPHQYLHKPATKLYNSWLAGVPAILGQESAFQAERRSELDYLEVTSKAELIAAILRLRNDHQLYRAMIENGKIRAQEIVPEKITNQWINFIQTSVIPSYQQWKDTSQFNRKVFLLRCELKEKLERIAELLSRSNTAIS